MCWVHWHYWLLAQKTDHSLYLWEAVWKESKRKRRTTDDFYFLQSFSHIRWKSHIWNGERIQLQDLSSNMFMTNLAFFSSSFFLLLLKKIIVTLNCSILRYFSVILFLIGIDFLLQINVELSCWPSWAMRYMQYSLLNDSPRSWRGGSNECSIVCMFHFCTAFSCCPFKDKLGNGFL